MAISFARTYTALIDTEPSQILTVSLKRNYLMLQNNSVSTIFLGFGSLPNVGGDNAIQLLPNATLTFDGNLVPNNEIYAVAAAQSRLSVVEGRKP